MSLGSARRRARAGRGLPQLGLVVAVGLLLIGAGAAPALADSTPSTGPKASPTVATPTVGPPADGSTVPAVSTQPATEAASGQAPSNSTPTRLAVNIDQLTPLIPKLGDTLVISGTVTNTGTDPVNAVSVRLRVSPTPLDSRYEIASIVNGTTSRDGTVKGQPVNLTDSLAGGATIAFTITMPISDLGLSSLTASVQILHVEALGDAVSGDGSGPDRLGLTRTFLPWFPNPTAVQPTKVVWLWPLTAVPDETTSGTQLSTGLGNSVASGGRLNALLSLAQQDPTALTYVADPALLEAVQTMIDGYRVQAPNASTASNPTASPTLTGTQSAAAESWLTLLRASFATTGMNVMAMPYANPDIVAMHRANLDQDLTRSITTAAARAAAVTKQPVTGTLAWPAGGYLDAGSLDSLRAAGTQTVLLSADALPSQVAQTVTPNGVAPLTEDGRAEAVLADPGLSEALTMPTTTASQALLARQRLLAEVAETTLQDPLVPRTIVAAPPALWSPNPATTSAWLTALKSSPWMTSSSLASLLALPAATSGLPVRSRADYPTTARRAELPEAYLARVKRMDGQLAALSAITANPADPTVTATQDALSRAESANWRGQKAAANRFIAVVGQQLASQLAKVHVVTRGTVTLAGEKGVVPITIANDLDQTVRIGLHLVGTPAVRFISTAYPTFTVPAGARVSVEIPAQVIGSGDVNVSVQLLTPDGHSYGTATALQVRSSAYAVAAQWAVGALVAALVALLAFRLVRRFRRGRPDHRPTDPAGDNGPPDNEAEQLPTAAAADGGR